MPNTQGGSEPKPSDLRKVLREGKRNEKMLFEAMTKKPKAPPAPASGGVEGITRVWAWDLGTSVASGYNVLAWPTGAFDVTDRGGTAPTVTQSGDGLILAEGYYMVTMDVYLSFSGTVPPAGRVFIDYDGSEYHYLQLVSPIVDDIVIIDLPTTETVLFDVVALDELYKELIYVRRHASDAPANWVFLDHIKVVDDEDPRASE